MTSEEKDYLAYLRRYNHWENNVTFKKSIIRNLVRKLYRYGKTRFSGIIISIGICILATLWVSASIMLSIAIGYSGFAIYMGFMSAMIILCVITIIFQYECDVIDYIHLSKEVN